MPAVSEYVRTYFRAWWNPAGPTVNRGEPVPLAAGDRRTFGTIKFPVPFGFAAYKLGEEFSRGADAWGYKSGVLERDPIGAGVVFKNKLPIMPAKTGTYLAGAIYWNTTPNGTGGPRLTPLLSATDQQLMQLR